MKLRTTLTAIAAGALLVTGGLTSHTLMTPPPSPYLHDCSDFDGGASPADALPGVCALPTVGDTLPALDTADYGTDIPRCASDDFNADHVARCYTERVTDNAVIILDQDDHVLATVTG